MRFKLFASLRIRLLLLICLAVIPLVGLILYTNVELRQQVTTGAKEEALRLARLAASEQEDTIQDTRQLLFALTQLSEVRGRDSAACSTFFARLLDQYPQYILLGVIEPDGDIFCSTVSPGSLSNVAHQAYFQRAFQTRSFAISDYQQDQISGKATLNFGYPVISETEQVEAVVFASLDLTWLNELAANAQLPPGATFSVIDRNGVILAHHPEPERWIGRPVPEAPVIEAILAQSGERTVEVDDAAGIRRLFAFTPLNIASEVGDLYISIGIPARVAFADAQRILIRNLGGLALVSLLALAAAWSGANLFILRRVDTLVSLTRRLSAGDLSVRTGQSDGQGELDQLAQAFDDMAASLERRVVERDQAETALRASQQAMEQRVVDRTRELSALYEVTALTSKSLNLMTILERSLEQVLTVMDSQAGAIHLLDETRQALHLAVWQGLSAEVVAEAGALGLNGDVTGWITQQGEPMVVSSISDDPRVSHSVLVKNFQVYVGAPMRARGRVVGVLSVLGEAGRHFRVEEVALLASIADEIGMAAEHTQLYEQAEQLAVMEERNRLARDLHDAVTQSLYSLTIFTDVVRRSAAAGDLERVTDYLDRLSEAAHQTLKEMRLLVYELRTSALETEGLVGALQYRLDAVEKRAGIESQLLVEMMAELPAVVEESLYRIAQEALNNALKHAGATSIVVRLNANDEEIELEVIDNGRAFDPDGAEDSGGLGLTSMRERVERLEGTLAISSKPGAGTRVRAKVPLRRNWAKPASFIDKFSKVAQ